MFFRYVVPFAVLSTPVLRAQTVPVEPPSDDVYHMDRLTVSTATRTERLLSEVPVRTEVVLREDIHMRVPTNFSQAVELLNGVRIESNCQNCNTAEVQLLGLGGSYNQILFDGMPLLSALGSVYGIEQIPAAFVDRLEVVKGGGSSLYGPGAVAGVINLVPIEPREAGGYVQVMTDVQEGEPLKAVEGRANLLLADGKVGLSVVGQASTNDGIDFNDDGYTEITAKDLVVGGFQVWAAPTTRTKLRANYLYTDETRRGGNRPDQPEWLANIAESLDTRYHRGGVTWEQVVSDSFDFRLAYAFAYIERDSFYGGLGDVETDPAAPGYDPAQLDPTVPGGAAATSYGQYGYTENPLHYWDSQFNQSLGAHFLSYGVQRKDESVMDVNRDFEGRNRAAANDDSFSSTGVFVQDEWAVTPELDLVLGARVDDNSTLEDLVFSPRIAAAWAATSTLKLRAAVSTGFRAPEVFDEDLHVNTLGAEPVGIRNAAGLGEERAVTTMLGFDWREADLGARWAIDGSVSFTDLTDTFVLSELQTDPADGSLYQERSNASGSTVAGFETNVAFEPVDTWRLTAGVAYYLSRHDDEQVLYDDTAEGGSTVIATRDYPKTPRWSSVMQAIWSPRDEFDAFVGVKYTGPMDVLNNNTATLNRTPEFWTIDAGFTTHLRIGRRHLDISAGVKNLLDERQRDLESGANRDSTYVYGPRFARSFYAAVKYEF